MRKSVGVKIHSTDYGNIEKLESVLDAIRSTGPVSLSDLPAPLSYIAKDVARRLNYVPKYSYLYEAGYDGDAGILSLVIDSDMKLVITSVE